MREGNRASLCWGAAWLLCIGLGVLGVGLALSPPPGAREAPRWACEDEGRGEGRWVGELRTPYGVARVREWRTGTDVVYSVEVRSALPFEVAFSRNDEALRFIGFRIRESEYFPRLTQVPGDLIVTTEGGARYEVRFRAREQEEVSLWIEAQVRNARLGKLVVLLEPTARVQ